MNIVIAKKSNAIDIARIQHASGYFWATYSLEKELEYAESLLNHERVFLVKRGNHFVGYISVRISKKTAELGMAVRAAYHGMGIGTMMMQHVINYCKRKKLSKIILSVWAGNVSAVHLYTKFKFKSILEQKGFYENGDALLKMELKL